MTLLIMLLVLILGGLVGTCLSLYQEVKKQQKQLSDESAKIEHLYHTVLGLCRMQFINPEMLKSTLLERKENYEFAKKIFLK